MIPSTQLDCSKYLLNYPKYPLLTYLPDAVSNDSNKKEVIQESVKEIFLKPDELSKEPSTPKAVLHLFKKDSPKDSSAGKADSTFKTISLDVPTPSLLGFYNKESNRRPQGTFMMNRNFMTPDAGFLDENGALTDAFFNPPEDLPEE